MSNNNEEINGLESELDNDQTAALEAVVGAGEVDFQATRQADGKPGSPAIQGQLEEANAKISLLLSKLKLKNEQIDMYRRKIDELRKALRIAEGPKYSDFSTANGHDDSEDFGTLRLLVADDGAATTEYVIPMGRTSLGSSTDNDIQLKNEFVSRHHAQIVSNVGACILGDLNSTNGTFVNSNRIKRYALHEGDCLTIGNLRFKYITRDVGNSKPAPVSAEHGQRE